MTPATAAPSPPADRPAPLPADRSLGFARQAHDRINGALLRCEERYPLTGPHSVHYVVVEGEAARWRERLKDLHQDLFGSGRSDPLAPVQLEVVDRATHEALERLAAAGLLTLTTRGSRPLFPEPETTPGPSPLSTEEVTKAEMHRAQAVRKLKMARLLGKGGLDEEVRGPLLEAMLAWGRKLAVESRLPEPAALEEALLPPLSHSWQASLPVLRSFVADPAAPWRPVAEALAFR